MENDNHCNLPLMKCEKEENVEPDYNVLCVNECLKQI